MSKITMIWIAVGVTAAFVLGWHVGSYPSIQPQQSNQFKVRIEPVDQLAKPAAPEIKHQIISFDQLNLENLKDRLPGIIKALSALSDYKQKDEYVNELTEALEKLLKSEADVMASIHQRTIDSMRVQLEKSTHNNHYLQARLNTLSSQSGPLIAQNTAKVSPKIQDKDIYDDVEVDFALRQINDDTPEEELSKVAKSIGAVEDEYLREAMTDEFQRKISENIPSVTPNGNQSLSGGFKLKAAGAVAEDKKYKDVDAAINEKISMIISAENEAEAVRMIKELEKYSQE